MNDDPELDYDEIDSQEANLGPLEATDSHRIDASESNSAVSKKNLIFFLSLVKRVGMMERIVVKEKIKAIKSLEYPPRKTHSKQILKITQTLTWFLEKQNLRLV